MKCVWKILTLMVLILGCSTALFSQELNNQTSKAPRIFIEGYYGLDYIRTKIPYMNYVRDRNDSDIHLQIRSQRTGSGGREYTLYFYGRNRFEKDDQILRYISLSDDTNDTQRAGLTSTIKLGLVNYLAKTSLAPSITVTFKESEKKNGEIKNRWDHWIFRTSFHTSFSGDANYQNSNLSGSLRAGRVTEKSKLNLSYHYSNYQNQYELDGETYTNHQSNWGLNGMMIKSINEHWSAGSNIRMTSSTYSNKKSSFKIATALEYNIFPYSEATKKQFVFNYTLGHEFSEYRELTIYNKMKENRFYHNLFIVYEQQTKWGSFFCSLAGTQYFFDLSKNQVRFRTSFSVNLFKGFRFNLYSRYSIIHDQLSIIKGDISTEEILLRQKELASSYNYSLSTGFSYSFGSIYNNVVNPRFDNW